MKFLSKDLKKSCIVQNISEPDLSLVNRIIIRQFNFKMWCLPPWDFILITQHIEVSCLSTVIAASTDFKHNVSSGLDTVQHETSEHAVVVLSSQTLSKQFKILKNVLVKFLLNKLQCWVIIARKKTRALPQGPQSVAADTISTEYYDSWE